MKIYMEISLEYCENYGLQNGYIPSQPEFINQELISFEFIANIQNRQKA